MALVKDNLFFHGASGKIGNQFVLRQHGGKTFTSRMPIMDKNAKRTNKQVRIRKLFASPVVYAKGAIASLNETALSLNAIEIVSVVPTGIVFGYL